MRTVLLVADLEGITGVDTLEALIVGAERYGAAARRMTEEVALVAQLLREAGVEHVRISDAHRSGAETNLDAALLPEGCSVHVTDSMYGGALLDDVEAVACVGMHASGISAGFGAHTVSVNTAWSLDGASINETQLARWLAAERGVPMWFSAGDQVLERELGGVVPFVRTKRSRSRAETTSRGLHLVHRAFRQVVRGPCAPVPKVPRAPLSIRFQREAEADAAVAAGAKRTSATTISVAPRGTFEAQYEEVLRFIGATEAAVLMRIEGLPGTRAFARSAARLITDDWE